MQKFNKTNECANFTKVADDFARLNVWDVECAQMLRVYGCIEQMATSDSEL